MCDLAALFLQAVLESWGFNRERVMTAVREQQCNHESANYVLLGRVDWPTEAAAPVAPMLQARARSQTSDALVLCV